MPILALLLLFLFAGCCTVPKVPPAPRAVSWSDLPGWDKNDLLPSWKSFTRSCSRLKTRSSWSKVCGEAMALENQGEKEVRAFFEEHFTPYALPNSDGSDEGLITGYYEPVIRGSLKPSSRYKYPVYGVPKNLISVDLSELYPELTHMRLRGRVVGNRLVPYYSRAQIAGEPDLLKGDEILWADDAIDLFFLQIQGSGRVMLPDGDMVRIGYADQNGYPYRSIGKVLVERGELSVSQASMEGIKAWGRSHPEKLERLLDENPSYVFFRFLKNSEENPPGSLGVPLSPGISIAVDTRVIPLGSPVYLSTTWPESEKEFDRLMLAQDTGGAIRGKVRADVYWGSGREAGELAGKTRQRGRLWVLLPR